MRVRTGLVLVAVVTVLVGGAVIGLTGVFGSGSGGDLTVRWTSDTARPDMGGNHHAPAAARVDGRGMVFAPISANGGTGCALVAIDAANGTTAWSGTVPPANCTIHSVADPTVADYDADGKREVLATTTEDAVVAYEPRTGTEEFRYDLTDYGYTQPIVADLAEGGGREVTVVDVDGTVFVLRPGAGAVWTRRLSAQTNAQPVVADFDADGANELAVGLTGDGNLTVIEGNGTKRWTLNAPFDSSITWMTTGAADDDPAIEVVVATTGGAVAAVDGATGEIEWRRDLGDFAAVHAFGDGDRNGSADVYAVAADGVLRGLNASDGTVEWETTLTSADVQMTPPPSLGDVDGDGSEEVVAVTNDGLVSVVDPDSGEILATYEREGGVPIWTHPTLADTDGDGAAEIYVIYGDGRVVSLAYSERTE